jgi:hypothetical protein
MKVFSVTAGFMKGPLAVHKILDEQLKEKLGDVTIYKITDTLYCEGPFETDPIMARVVVYDRK